MTHRQAAPVLVLVASVVLAVCGGASASAGAAGTTVYRFGVVGNRGPLVQLERDKPTVVAGIKGEVVQIATSNSDGYALTSNGQVYAWGVASYGSSAMATSPLTAPRPSGSTFRPREDHLAPQPDAVRRCPGDRLQGAGVRLGAERRRRPVQRGLIQSRPERIPLSDVTLATGARTHALFDSHGRVYACGSGDAGELGDGSTASHATPTRVVGLPAGER